MTLQFRPMEGTVPSRLFYSPARDLANCGYSLIHTALQNLQQALDNGKYKELTQQYGIETEDIHNVIRVLGQAYDKAMQNQTDAAYKETGLLTLPTIPAAIVFAELGFVLFDACVAAVKDAHLTDESIPPLQIEQFLEQLKGLRNAENNRAGDHGGS